ncbi:MAG: tyrosine-type recombinase/integrase [Parasphingopyxis sp.]|uniref:tyrosine-type recombinase/integrase n=1 Tax=Parasphingopyxis sp. TaxID=1920299 RepID=UPI003F9F177C
MAQPPRPRGRPKRYAKYDELEASLPKVMAKRPLYCDGIGLFRGQKAYTVWVKIKMTRGGEYKGRAKKPGEYVEIKLGERSSWTWEQLERERDRLQGLADRGEPLIAEASATFADHADDWLARKKSTIKGYGVSKGHVEKQLKPVFGAKSLDTITVGGVNKWIAKQLSSLKPATVQRQLSTFNSIMNDAVRSGDLDKNPAKDADKIRGIESRQRFVTDEEWDAILETADTIESEKEARADNQPNEKRGWLRDYVDWAYQSGMRRGEIVKLAFSDIRELEPGHTVVEVTGTKNNTSRFVTCTPEMLAIIERLRGLEREADDDRLFPLSLTTVKRTLTKLWKRCGLEDVRLHDLRRTHATKLMGMGVDPRTIAGRIGHRGTDMLAKVYAVDRGDKEAAAMFHASSKKAAPGKAKANREGAEAEPLERAERGDEHLAAPEGYWPFDDEAE